MNRRTILTRLAILFIAIAGIFAIGGRASAEPLLCCDSYTLDIDCTVPDFCYPIWVTTVWNNGISHTSPFFAGCGSFNIPVVPPLAPCYAAPANLKYLTVNGSPIQVTLNKETRVVINGCCYLVYAFADPVVGGCMRVRIRPCV